MFHFDSSSFSQLYIEVQNKTFQPCKTWHFFLLTCQHITFFRIFHSSLAQGSFPASPNFPSNHLEECIPLTPAIQGWPGWLVDKLVQTLNCSSLQETKSCPAHQSRTQHSFLSVLVSFIFQTIWSNFREATVQLMFCTQLWQCLGKTCYQDKQQLSFMFSEVEEVLLDLTTCKRYFYKEFDFSPTLPVVFFSDYYSQTTLRGYSHEHHTQWGSWNYFFWHR